MGCVPNALAIKQRLERRSSSAFATQQRSENAVATQRRPGRRRFRKCVCIPTSLCDIRCASSPAHSLEHAKTFAREFQKMCVEKVRRNPLFRQGACEVAKAVAMYRSVATLRRNSDCNATARHKITFSNSSPKTLACETFIYKTLTVFNSSRKRLRLNSGWNADAQARLRLNSCRETQLRLSCDAQLGCVKLSDCVPNVCDARLRPGRLRSNRGWNAIAHLQMCAAPCVATAVESMYKTYI